MLDLDLELARELVLVELVDHLLFRLLVIVWRPFGK